MRLKTQVIGSLASMATMVAPLLAAGLDGPVPAAPGGPGTATSVARACPTFHWSVVPRAAGYELAVYRIDGDAGDPRAAALPRIHQRLDGNVGGWTLPPGRCLEPGSRYAWSVRVIGPEAAVESPWSEPALFEVAPAPSLAEIEAALELLRRNSAEDHLTDASMLEGPVDEPAHAAAKSAGEPARTNDLQTPLAPGAAGPGSRAAPAQGASPSLVVDDQIHLGEDSDVFRQGVPFLWTDGVPTGSGNLGLGLNALAVTTGTRSTAVGNLALRDNTTGSSNSAFGEDALRDNTLGSSNTAVGQGALRENETGARNTAMGQGAMLFNDTGWDNTALGEDALKNVRSGGSDNIGIGRRAGFQLGTTSDNIMIGNEGLVTDSQTIRIGVQGTHLRTHIAGISGISVGGANVVVGSDGRLGVGASSRRFKEDVRDMDEVSEVLSRLRPVRFRYKPEHTSAADRLVEYGLIAEEVAEVLPELVARDADGEPYTVRYDLLSSLLLKELQRLQRTNDAVDLQQARLIGAQRTEIETLKGELAGLRRTLDRRRARR